MNNLKDFLDDLSVKSPLQKKKVSKFFQENDLAAKEANDFIQNYTKYLESENISFDKALDSYLELCRDMITSQIYFIKNGRYPLDQNENQALEKVYNSEKKMKSLMIGLALSQVLWETHYEMFKEFKQQLSSFSKKTFSYLEIGPGHGMFLNESLQILEKCERFVAVDISQTAIDITKSIISFFNGVNNKIEYETKNMMDMEINEKFDFITMGEVLEHVNEPEILLKKLRDLLSKEGKGFISTCVNCPSIDHVYHFRKVEEIRQMISNCDLEILSEKVLPVEKMPFDEVVEKKITINYCAIISNKNER